MRLHGGDNCWIEREQRRDWWSALHPPEGDWQLGRLGTLALRVQKNGTEWLIHRRYEERSPSSSWTRIEDDAAARSEAARFLF